MELRRGTLEHSSSSNGPKKWRNSGGHDYFRIQTVKNECKALGGKYNGFRVTYVECVTDERKP